MKRTPARAILILVVAAAATLSAAPSQDVLRVREWRAAHERQILDELMRLVSLPNIASNQADIAKNADLLTAMFEQRGFAVTRIVTPGSPLLVARRDAPNAEMLQYGGALGSLSQRSSCFRCSVIERNKTRKRTTPTCRRVPSARCSTTITSNRKSGRMKSAARTKAAQSDDGRDGE